MGRGRVWIVVSAAAIACACRPAPVPTALPATPALAEPLATPPPPPPATAVVQSALPGAWPVWGSHGGTVALLGSEVPCVIPIHDVLAGLVTAQLPGCSPVPDPKGDGFMLRSSATELTLWSPDRPARLRHVPVSASQQPIVWSPDGSRLAVLEQDWIVLIDPETGQEVRRVLVPTAGMLSWIGTGASVAPWSADGAYLVVRGRIASAWIVGVGQDETQTLLDCAPGIARFAPRGDALGVSCMNVAEARVWSASEHRVVTQLPSFFSRWSATGRYVLTIDRHLGEQVRDAATNALVLSLGQVDGADPRGPLFSPDDAWVAVPTQDGQGRGKLTVWDVPTGKPLASYPGTSRPQWSGDGAYLSAQELPSKTSTGRLVVVEAGSWKERWSRPGPDDVVWAPVGARLAVAGAMGVDVVDLHALTSRPATAAESVVLAGVVAGTGGSVVIRLEPRVAGGACEGLRVDAQGRPSVIVLPCDPNGYEVPSPDGSMSTHFGPRAPTPGLRVQSLLTVEDTATGARSVVDSGVGMQLLSWSARGHRLLVGGWRSVVYDADTRRVWAVRPNGLAWAIDDDGERVAVGTQDGPVQVVTVESKDAPLELPAASSGVPAQLALSGDRLAAVAEAGTVTVWDVAQRSIVASWDGGIALARLAWGGGATLASPAFLAVAGRQEVRLSKTDGSGTITLVALRTAHGTTWLARDADGRVDGPPEALAALSWQTTDAQGVGHTGEARLQPGMIEMLVQGKE